jgi:hypothetical protein
VTISPNALVYGQAVTFTATVKANAPGTGVPSGTVQFYDGSTKLGTVNQGVTQDTPTVAVTSTSPAAKPGDSVIFTATVSSSLPLPSPDAKAPSGNVQFYDGSTKLGTPITVSTAGITLLIHLPNIPGV